MGVPTAETRRGGGGFPLGGAHTIVPEKAKKLKGKINSSGYQPRAGKNLKAHVTLRRSQEKESAPGDIPREGGESGANQLK